MITIKVEERDDYWTCGDGCCSNYETVNVFHYDGETYEYRGSDAHYNFRNFAEEVLKIKFEYDYDVE
jgi:hypothetical protein